MGSDRDSNTIAPNISFAIIYVDDDLFGPNNVVLDKYFRF